MQIILHWFNTILIQNFGRYACLLHSQTVGPSESLLPPLSTAKVLQYSERTLALPLLGWAGSAQSESMKLRQSLNLINSMTCEDIRKTLKMRWLIHFRSNWRKNCMIEKLVFDVKNCFCLLNRFANCQWRQKLSNHLSY
jgi:hypothetical protein